MKSTKPVSERSTKQEILEAYQELSKKIEETPVTESVVASVVKTNKVVLGHFKEQTVSLTSMLDEAIGNLEADMDTVTRNLESIKNVGIEQKKILEEEKERILKDRTREQEEYTYQFAKQKKRQEEDLKEQREKADLEIAERKAQLKAQEDELTDLRGQVKTFEARMAKSIADAVEKTTQELTITFDHEKALTTEKTHATETLLEQRITLLEETIASQKHEIDRLNKAATEAASQVTRIAERAVTKAPPEFLPPSPSQPKRADTV